MSVCDTVNRWDGTVTSPRNETDDGRTGTLVWTDTGGMEEGHKLALVQFKAAEEGWNMGR